ncbi:FAD-dependent oxidoreductase [Sorangium sp. So ce260]|uniref:flavin monoamine oxidase family protein n=1 Tax=Sorangium sp. So ce260 TaxID=3133291 RepID=UPI003F5FF215
MDSSKRETLDVAIIGGGVTGTYCAWRLTGKDAPQKRSVALFEYGDRIGGRLYTKRLPRMPHVPVELGGMRFIPPSKDDPTSGHPMVSNLVEKGLGLPIVDFYMGNPQKGPDGRAIGDSENILYLRGKHLKMKEQGDPAKVPYNLAWNERGKTVNDLQLFAMNLLVPNNAELSLSEWMTTKVYGQELYTFGFWNLMQRTLSSEAYQFMKDAGGYDANVANANAVSQLPATEYTDDTVFKSLRDGYQALPLSLREKAEAAGAEIYMNHRLARIDREDEHTYRLTFHRTKTEVVKTDFHGEHEVTRDDPAQPHPVFVYAREIILALPRRSLELIEWSGWHEQDRDKKEVKHMLHSVLVQHALKLLLGYNYPWWRAQGLVAGRSITDLPVRQIYYFGSEQDQQGGEPGNTRSLLMASYNDISTVPFWRGLENGPPYRGEATAADKARLVDKATAADKAAAGGKVAHLASPRSDCVATKAMVESAHKQILEVHGLVDLDMPYAAIYHDWSADPYGGGWHEWKAGYRYDLLMPRIRRPLETHCVYICGEAYSNNQGWVEGCLQTAEHVLRDHFNMPWPEWLAGLDHAKVLGP